MQVEEIVIPYIILVQKNWSKYYGIFSGLANFYLIIIMKNAHQLHMGCHPATQRLDNSGTSYHIRV